MSENPVVILTALDVEYDEVRARLGDLRTELHPAGTRFEVGRLDATGPLIALTLTGKGNLPAGTLTERAIAQFSPAAVIFVGIARRTSGPYRYWRRGGRYPRVRLSRGYQRR